MKKKLAALTLACAMVAGCTASAAIVASADDSSSDSEKNYKVSVVLKNGGASEHWRLITAGCDAYMEDHPNVQVEVVGPPSETSYDEQQNTIETNLANESFDAYVIAPLQSELAANLISGETRPVIAMDTNIDADEITAFVGTGNKEAAKQGAAAAVEAAKEAGWEEINCIEISGVQGDATNTARLEGYKEGIEENGGTFLEDEIQYADAVADKAVVAMEAIMQTHPEGVAIICANNDDMAVAAARTAAGNEAFANTIFLGFDGQVSACESILDGQLTMSVAQQPYDMGYLACETAVAAASGEDVEDIDSGCEIITADNAQERIDKMSGYLEEYE